MLRKSCFRLVPVLLVLFFGESPSLLRAQQAENMAIAAEELLQQGNIQGAVERYEEISSKYPTFEGIWAVRYNLGFAYYSLGSYDKAIEIFKLFLDGKNVDPNLKEESALIMGGVIAGKANAQAKDDDRRKLLESSIAAYDDFLKKYPNSKSTPEALYGKAATQYQLGRLEEAERTIGTFLQTAVQSNLKEEANYLLARICSSQAKLLREQGKEAEAAKRIDAAKKLFDVVREHQGDMVLANEATFSAGDALVNASAYAEAIAYLRKVKPQSWIEESQRNLMEDIRKARNQAIGAGNQRMQNELGRRLDRARSKLNAIRKGTSLYLSAQQLIAKCYYDQKKYDEVVLLSRHFLPQFDSDQQRRARYMIIKALLEKKEADKAIAEYATFNSQFPKDKLGENIPIAFSEYFLRTGKARDSMKWADEYEGMYPQGEYLEQAYFLASNAATASGDTAEAERRNKKFREKFPKSSLMGSALFQKAYLSYQKKEYAEAIRDFREYVTKFPDVENSENAAFLVAMSLFDSKKFDEAITEFKAFETKYAKGKLIVQALYQLAQAYEEKRDYANANAVYARIVKDWPGDDIAPYAQFGIGNNFTSMGLKQSAQAVEAFDHFIKLFPEHKLVPRALLYKAGIHRNSGKLSEAQTAYVQLAEKYPQSDSAADALVEVGEMYYKEASQMATKPDKLPPEKQTVWKDSIQKSQEAYEQVLKKYPSHSSVDKALSKLNLLWQARVNARFATLDQAKSYFTNLSTTMDPGLGTKIAFALGGLLSALGDKASALSVLQSAFEKAEGVSLPNEGYKQYRNLLIANKQYDKAIEISKKQLQEKVAAADEAGIAEANVGLGLALFEKDDLVQATACFKEVISKYAWHEKAAFEAELYDIWILEKKRDYTEAIKRYNVLLKKIARTDVESQGRISIRLGYAWFGSGEISATAKADAFKQAVAYFVRIGMTFQAYPAYASEGMYMGALGYEKWAAAASDAKIKAECSQSAVSYYKRCIQEYPETPWAEKAKERLKALGK